jgi:uncharacterized protein (TIGR03643 family)
MKKTDLPSGLPVPLSAADLSAIIAMAWQDDTPFEAMALQFGLSEAQVIALMREHLKTRSFRVWRMRVRGRAAKHQRQHLTRQQSQHPTRRHNPSNMLLDTHASAEALATEADTAPGPSTAAVTPASLR